jgi:PAS domain S-box-containing protein
MTQQMLESRGKESEAFPQQPTLTVEAERLSRMLSFVPVGVYACDAEGRITFFNRRAVELWGRAPKLNDSQEKFCACWKVFLPDGTFVPPEQTPMAMAVREGKSFRNIEAVVERPDGSTFVASVNIDVSRNEEGKIVEAINVFQDITGWKQAEEKLRARDDRLAEDVRALTLLQEVGNQCVRSGDEFNHCLNQILDTAISITGAEKGTLQLLDPPSEALVIVAQRGFDEPFLSFFQLVRDDSAAVCGEARRAEERVVVEDVTRSKIFAGQPALDVLLAAGVRAVQATPLLSAGGNLLGILCTHFGRLHRPNDHAFQLMDLLARQAADYVERTRSEEPRARLAAIVDQSDDAIISKDLNGIIRSWNQGAERLFGYTAEEVRGRPVTILIPPDRTDEEPGILDRIRQGKRIDHYDTVRQRKDGTLLDVSLTVSPIKNAAGKIIGASTIARDITERIRAKDRLEQAVAERTASLREAIAQMEEFSYTVSHDLRAPLRGMHGYSGALLEDFGTMLPPEAKHYVERIASNSKRLDQMVLDVLTFSQVARADFRLERVDVDKLMQQIIEHYPGMQPPRARIQVEPLPAVLGHEPSVTQVFSNLLNNAVKFVPPSVTPRVRVWGEQKDGLVYLWVEDNGIGIAPNLQHRLFRMFERVHPELKHEGMGVGLAIVRKAVERMGGAVGIESDGVHGSRFWVKLRAAEA